MFQGDFIVETSLVGNVLNGLSHFHRVRDRSEFAICLIRGLGGNLTEVSREEFAKQVTEDFISFVEPQTFRLVLLKSQVKHVIVFLALRC